MATIKLTNLPRDEHGTVNYRVPLGAYVLRHDDRVYAEPGDHIHGISTRTVIDLNVWPADDCMPCRMIAAHERLARR